jgi:hypothetical protein
MILYTCPAKKHAGATPILQHPCGVAAKALDKAGFIYDIEVVGGFKNVPFSRRGKRATIRELTGQEDVPVLITHDGSAVHGTDRIVAWAGENAPSTR